MDIRNGSCRKRKDKGTFDQLVGQFVSAESFSMCTWKEQSSVEFDSKEQSRKHQYGTCDRRCFEYTFKM
uniref:Uncharacterized protein n=1 Tax=Caenorhabditis japonica TaxID=281687 RepID=A0A8R1IE41_CAEJA